CPARDTVRRSQWISGRRGPFSARRGRTPSWWRPSHRDRRDGRRQRSARGDRQRRARRQRLTGRNADGRSRHAADAELPAVAADLASFVAGLNPELVWAVAKRSDEVHALDANWLPADVDRHGLAVDVGDDVDEVA